MSKATLRLVASALERLVRAEYGDRYSLAEIASTWGNASPDEIEALEAWGTKG